MSKGWIGLNETIEKKKRHPRPSQRAPSFRVGVQNEDPMKGIEN